MDEIIINKTLMLTRCMIRRGRYGGWREGKREKERERERERER